MRKEARLARMKFVASLETDTRLALEAQLADRLADLVDAAEIIAGYAAIGSEISPEVCLARAARKGRTIAYPTFTGDDEQFLFRAGDPVMPGPHQIRQPADDAPLVKPDLVLVPLVACGNGGARLGQGKGHYDRVLARLVDDGARLVGIGWKVQRLERDLPSEPWDVPLHAFCSPRGIEFFD
ncbi:5-formyltetrahydrofolate cyclo-ligase [Sphingomicrobium lutaoense]|uniref:5-formyltetrahydrofolate cyclo-ligase n=1 Tax=Sphingomicrobium lutaoense TaxID=515949 RepID=A0A839YXJ2_9SPHN|nr:5-formyltetrahydrofolate cyclo-ligase [Sphingomicrobium lutaoense]MBB3763899.1 5-formyltetrahydrofolate cyclo-ligase [Sphingomicrobium lutaoense]